MVDTVLRNEAKKTNEALARNEALLTRLCDGLEADRVEREAAPVVTGICSDVLHERLRGRSEHMVMTDDAQGVDQSPIAAVRVVSEDDVEANRVASAVFEAKDLRGRIRFFKGCLESVYPDAFIQRRSIEAQIEKYEARLKELEVQPT